MTDIFTRLQASTKEPDPSPEDWAARALAVMLTLANSPENFDLTPEIVDTLVEVAAFAPTDTFLMAAAILHSVPSSTQN